MCVDCRGITYIRWLSAQCEWPEKSHKSKGNNWRIKKYEKGKGNMKIWDVDKQRYVKENENLRIIFSDKEKERISLNWYGRASSIYSSRWREPTC